MTNRNRRPRAARPARSARMVWVNARVSVAPTVSTLGAEDLLAGAQEFMKFDTTILGVVITRIAFSLDSNAVGRKDFACALEVGKDTLDSLDFENPLVSSIGPAWLWHGIVTQPLPIADNQNLVVVTGADGATMVKAKRRFRENDATLWFIHNNATNGADDNLALQAYFRILLRIP